MKTCFYACSVLYMYQLISQIISHRIKVLDNVFQAEHGPANIPSTGPEPYTECL